MMLKTTFIVLAAVVFLGCGTPDDPVTADAGRDTIDVDTNVPDVDNRNDSADGASNPDMDIVIDLEPKVASDSALKLLLYNGRLATLPESIQVGQKTYRVAQANSEFLVGKPYPVDVEGEMYQLYKTDLPIISVSSGDREIVDEPKVLGDFQLWDKGNIAFESRIGIEVRGGFSQTFPKQSFSVELWEDDNGNSLSANLLGMRVDDDWILDGLWNEPLRLRDFVSHDLWLEIGRHPYADEEPDITFGVKREFCELFLNGKYRGVYYLSEKIDRKQLGLKRFENGEIRGELFKSTSWGDGVLFSDIDVFSNESESWSGYEAKYPDDVGELDWTNLHDFVSAVVSSNQNTFDASVIDRVSLDNMADYFIYMNVIYAADNRGKNIYTGRYDRDRPYFYVAWDMDGSFGNDWRGDRIDETQRILTNGLFSRLLENDAFKSEVVARWTSLRTNVLKTENLQSRFTMLYNLLRENGVYEREALDLQLPRNYSEEEIDFIHSWIQRRTEFLDTYFSSL